MRRAAGCIPIVLLPLTVTGCSSVTAGDDRLGAAGVRISPPLNSTEAGTRQGLVVRTGSGRLAGVTAYAGGTPVPGRLDGTRTTWRSDWALAPDREYIVNVTTSAADGTTVTTSGRFRTLTPTRTFQVRSVTPDPGETVGVGMPIIVDFTAPVEDRAAVEQALEVRSTRPVEGAWHWVSDAEVVYRPRRDWPPHQQVSFTAHLSGVRASKGTYGTADHTVPFAIGRGQVSYVDAGAHRMRVVRDGEVVQRMAISAGMATTEEYTTTSGVHLTMDKADPVRMVSPGRKKGDPGFYDVMIDHAVRISNSGEYIHAKNNVWAQGRQNVSHGCVNARPDQAAWFFDSSLRGDPVVISGTDRALAWNNGWGYWQRPWEEWLKGSALHAATLTRPLPTPLPAPAAPEPS
ncbi:lipoprotein-anchoring transpeptidase ErfK/SrfK [Streptosporangium album]|uniref:Lipoprotein-anchoring transpeptidase ErfK/SrfK n=1 Tax=Streptosporangium album TaxID=47479 RepID=A0A7W7RV41_9ACTN|nr:Ig-like domain-containing protein [Streptosporangium album]MBB4937946.1 lipoprotein-anchoring transpeptidase ErfK/SrfK [Streptosporangium album]